MTAKFIKYAQPLISGEVEVPFENGVPAYVRLSKRESVRYLILTISNKLFRLYLNPLGVHIDTRWIFLLWEYLRA